MCCLSSGSFRWVITIDDAVDRCIGEIGLSLAIMILFSKYFLHICEVSVLEYSLFPDSALMQFFEKTVQPYEFHTWMYCIWVTTATVGYGDIT
jgi:hypothetical protein